MTLDRQAFRGHEHEHTKKLLEFWLIVVWNRRCRCAMRTVGEQSVRERRLRLLRLHRCTVRCDSVCVCVRRRHVDTAAELFKR